MDLLIWPGAGLTLIGLVGLIACIVAVVRARKSGLEESEMRALLQRVVAWNMGALALSAIGLMMVIVGIVL